MSRFVVKPSSEIDPSLKPEGWYVVDTHTNKIVGPFAESAAQERAAKLNQLHKDMDEAERKAKAEFEADLEARKTESKATIEAEREFMRRREMLDQELKESERGAAEYARELARQAAAKRSRSNDEFTP